MDFAISANSQFRFVIKTLITRDQHLSLILIHRACSVIQYKFYIHFYAELSKVSLYEIQVTSVNNPATIRKQFCHLFSPMYQVNLRYSLQDQNTLYTPMIIKSMQIAYSGLIFSHYRSTISILPSVSNGFPTSQHEHSLILRQSIFVCAISKQQNLSLLFPY